MFGVEMRLVDMGTLLAKGQLQLSYILVNLFSTQVAFNQRA